MKLIFPLTFSVVVLNSFYGLGKDLSIISEKNSFHYNTHFQKESGIQTIDIFSIKSKVEEKNNDIIPSNRLNKFSFTKAYYSFRINNYTNDSNNVAENRLDIAHYAAAINKIKPTFILFDHLKDKLLHILFSLGNYL